MMTTATPDDAILRLRAEGDQLRDNRRWAEARWCYSTYLASVPDDWAIHIQLGHCLKEEGAIAEGLAAYQQALVYAPTDSDLHLQIGHALKLLDQKEDALVAYRQALLLDPHNDNAQLEIGLLETILSQQHAPAVTRQKCILFDITDLIQYMREWRVPTGIQRVQINVIYYAMTAFDDLAKYHIIHFDQTIGSWIPLNESFFLELYLAAGSGDDLNEEDFANVLELAKTPQISEEQFDFILKDNDVTLVNLGTSWWIENYFLKIRHLRQKYAIRYVPMIHDAIPLMTPEHCAQRLVEDFSQWFSTLVFEIDGAVTNSRWSAMDIRHLANEVWPDIDLPVFPIALNCNMQRHLSDQNAITNSVSLQYILPPGSVFVLFVGTLESRKNHLLLFKAWDLLLQKYDPAKLPTLICLGKAGWLFDEAADFLRARPALNEKIMLISSVTDDALESLYRQSMFTIFNSFYEGWGLPVTESLSFGTLPLVACNTSLAEAGGRAAVYFRDNDLDDLICKLEMLIFDDAKRQELQREASGNVKLRDWQAIAKEFLDRILQIDSSASRRQETHFRISLGQPIHLGKSEALSPSIDLALPNLLRDGLNWHRLEHWGCWTQPGIATLRLPLPDDALGKDLLLFLRFRGTAEDTPINIVLGMDETRFSEPTRRVIGHGIRHTMSFQFRSFSRVLSIAIDAGPGSSLGPGDRDVGIGITHLMLCHADDAGAEQRFIFNFPELLERFHREGRAALDRVEIHTVT